MNCSIYIINWSNLHRNQWYLTSITIMHDSVVQGIYYQINRLSAEGVPSGQVRYSVVSNVALDREGWGTKKIPIITVYWYLSVLVAYSRLRDISIDILSCCWWWYSIPYWAHNWIVMRMQPTHICTVTLHGICQRRIFNDFASWNNQESLKYQKT